MQNGSLEAFLHLGDSPRPLPLDTSHYSWQQPTDHKGRPGGKVRFGLWSFRTSRLDEATYRHLLELMLSDTAVVDARAEYLRADGQGVFVTVWGRRCTVCHVFDYFDSRGTHGQQPAWVLYFSLAAEQMGRAAGAAGAFVLPAARSYAYGPPAAGETKLVAVVSSLLARPLLKNDADPIQDLLGPGRVSHPQEWQQTITFLREEGVDVVFRKGVMAYGPQAAPGTPGRLIIDPDASIGALRHETQHYLDDKAQGLLGMKALLLPKT